MVEVKNLVKNYGEFKALKGVSFTVNEGEIIGFLGPNGAGKSTTMNIITGYLSSSEGSVSIDGYDVFENPMEARVRVGYLPEQPPLYSDMTVEKYLEFIYGLKKVKLSKKKHIEEIMKLVKIDDIKNRVIGNLSKGYKQRVGFAQALIGNPPVVILDEPTVGLDPRQIVEMRSIIKSLRKKHTVIFSSHVLSEVANICDRIVVISDGEIVADAKTDELSALTSDVKKISVTVEGTSSTVLSVLGDIEGVMKVRRVAPVSDSTFEYVVEYKKDTDVRRNVFRVLAKADLPILEMTDAGLSLEDSYMQLTKAAYAENRKRGGAKR